MNNKSNNEIRVLLIEDNPGDARLLRELLSEAVNTRFRVQHALDLASGLERLAAGDIDIALLDLSLPDSHGADTFRRAHACAPQVPMIVLSGTDNEALAVKTVQEGAQDYLVKGHADGPLLARSLLYAIERKRAQEELALYAAALQKKNEQIEADLRLARKVQQAFMPRQYPRFPNDAAPDQNALQFCHRWLPTSTLGGDFFDVLALSDTQAGVLIVDVMGHGLRSALITAMMHAVVGEHPVAAHDPAMFLTELNRHLYRISDQDDSALFASAFYLVTDAGAGQMRYACAGHPFPRRLRREAGTVETLPGLERDAGPALGVLRYPDFSTIRGEMQTGDALVFFTDGLTEADGLEGEYGEARFDDFLKDHLASPLSEIFDGLLADIRAFSGRNDFDDDVCLVGLDVARTGFSDTGPTLDARDLEFSSL